MRGLSIILLVFAFPLFAFAASPTGYFDVITNDGFAQGWALDPDTPDQSVAVHFYGDGTYSTGTFLGYAVADQYRADVKEATGVTGSHGFYWKLPAAYQSAGHKIYVYAIDTSGNNDNPQLTLSPKDTVGPVAPPGNPTVDGDAEVRGRFKNSDIVVRTSDTYAGAIDSLVWNGVQFISNEDPGLLLQSAVQLDFYGEGLNPTEGGSEITNGVFTHSVLKSLQASGATLNSAAQMAYWATPGRSRAHNTTGLSPDIVRKQVTIGVHGMPNVIEHAVTFELAEPHVQAQFEILTAYSPGARFTNMYTYDPRTDTLGPGASLGDIQHLPIITATEDGAFALGVYSPSNEYLNGRYTFAGSGYWGHYFTEYASPYSKWSCMVRASSVQRGGHSFRCFSIVGSLADVKAAIRTLNGLYPIANQSVSTGALDGISTSGQISGWAYDPNSSSEAVHVDLYFDDDRINGFAGRALANQPRPDVNEVVRITGNHGFTFTVPARFLIENHHIYAYAIPKNTSDNHSLIGVAVIPTIPTFDGSGGGGGFITPITPTPATTTTTTIASSTKSVAEKVAALLAQIQQLQALIGKLKGTSAAVPQSTDVGASVSYNGTCPVITRALSRGSRGTDVTALQRFFVSQYENFTVEYVTGFFGAMTEAALKQWQNEKGLVSSGTPAATGYGAVGPKTRAAIAACK